MVPLTTDTTIEKIVIDPNNLENLTAVTFLTFTSQITDDALIYNPTLKFAF